MTFNRTPEFNKDLKKLQKKWHTLEKDLKVAERAIGQVYENPDLYEPFFSTKNATVMSSNDSYEVSKMRLKCTSPGAKGKARIVFVFARVDGEITLLEIYSKSEKDREDSTRVHDYLTNNQLD